MYGGALSSELDRERYREAVCHALNKYFNEDPMVGVEIELYIVKPIKYAFSVASLVPKPLPVSVNH